MWVSREEYERLVQQAAHGHLSDKFEARALAAEEALQAERASKDWLVTQLASRLATKAGTYGLDHESPKRSEPTAHPKGFIKEPDEFDLARLGQYVKWARDAGVPDPETDAQMRWEAEMRGEAPPPVEYDAEQ